MRNLCMFPTVHFVLYERSLHASCKGLTHFLVMYTLYFLNISPCIVIHRLHAMLNLLFAHTEWNRGPTLTQSAKYHYALYM